MLSQKLKNHHIILASGSPRRQQLLRGLDIDFEVRLKDVEEIYPDSLRGKEITEYLTKLKSDAFDALLAPNDILITSDTIVWFEDKALGKPKDEKEALHMLRSLSGNTHLVITSVGFRTHKTFDVITETTRVTFNPLTDEAIRYYVENYRPLDKAGSYGIQEWIGFVAVSKIEGSYANVMGFPVDRVFEYLSAISNL
ncbi:septum formation protein Maf [Flavobacterium magnum]|uniref:dTTP/UTP pyrophosphatase n=1 Tax=Flavobacterium magnum TaxID=2162713 RepID=A0A2S0RFW7_9FLAO|nr:Maf family nucleotide pyrophosphatase [Flavobacterium magnum]AWA30429.1 septum formation protein Maf [Flavobacterium magnum]